MSYLSSAGLTHYNDKMKTILAGKSNTNHTHNYAGSSSAGGSANSAVKLATARTIGSNSSSLMTFSATFDGSANVTGALNPYYSTSTVGNTNNYPWHRIATYDTNASWCDAMVTLFLTGGYNGAPFGIVRIVLRTDNGFSTANASVTWLLRSGYAEDAVQACIYVNSSRAYIDVYLKTPGTYDGQVIQMLTAGSRNGMARTYTLISSSEASDTTTSDKKSSSEVYASLDAAGTSIRGAAYSKKIAGADGTAVNYAKSANSANKATQDSAGQQINTTYIKGLSVNGRTITYTRGDGTTGTITTQDSNTTYSTGTASASGLTKLYTGTGTATDGTMTQSAIKSALDGKASSSHTHAYSAITGTPTLGDAASKTVRTATAVTASGWKDKDTDNNYVPTMSFIAYWNGAYTGSTSNLAYCNKGAFGTIVTKNADDYAAKSHTHNYAGSSSAGGAANSVANSIAIKLNGGTTEGTNLFTFNGSAGKTINITPSAIGAAASSHTHNYAGSGSAGGSANSAVKLDTATAGSATQPVYFSGGKPVACTYTLGKSVPSNAVFTDTNTWRGVQNNLTSDATDQSLSAAQGKVLKGLVDGKAAANHEHSVITNAEIDEIFASL